MGQKQNTTDHILSAPLNTYAEKQTNQPFIDEERAAIILHRAPRTIQQWAKDGKIPAYALNRSFLFKESELIAFIESKKISDYQR